MLAMASLNRKDLHSSGKIGNFATCDKYFYSLVKQFTLAFVSTQTLIQMPKTNFPFKVALGYAIAVIVLVLALSLVYSNTTSILAINQASREYIKKRNSADSVMSNLLKEEQRNLKELADAFAGNRNTNYLKKKVDSLNNGKDSVVVQSRSQQSLAAKNTTVEVVKSKKGFFKRLADAFKKEHAETLSIRHDSNVAVIDTITAPVNVANEVADILKQIDKEEKKRHKGNSKAVSKEMNDLKIVNAQLAMRSAKQLNELHQQERLSMEQSINQAINARQHLLGQIAMLAIIAIAVTLILFIYIWRDNKKERIYREELERANDETNRIMKQRERLLLTITHDIKAPVASISGFIDLMRDYIKDERGLSCLANIKSSASHLAELVAALLDYHQLEKGLIKLNPVNFSPHQLVTQCAESYRILAQQKGIAITCEYNISPIANEKEYADNDVSTTFFADAFRIRQIINNLLSNAIKYTERGNILISASIRPNVAQATLTVSVKDTGKGMTAQEQERVFAPFTRLDNAQGIEGTGLGLSITKELTMLLGGSIELHSEVGKGSVFTVTIPLEKGSESASATESSLPIAKSYRPITPTGEHIFANHKVLILDDDKLQLQLLREMLSRIVDNTWQVLTCNHITEALTLLHKEQPALMFMDIEMPEMNGMELIKHINHSNMTVIAMTAHDDSFINQIQLAGFDGCLFKPFGILDIAKILGVENYAASTSDNVAHTSKDVKTDMGSILAFAAGDADTEREIMNTMKVSLYDYLAQLQELLPLSSLPYDRVSKIAHKMLPIASMLQFEHTEDIKALSPELIHNFDDSEIKHSIRLIIDELHTFLERI